MTYPRERALTERERSRLLGLFGMTAEEFAEEFDGLELEDAPLYPLELEALHKGLCTSAGCPTSTTHPIGYCEYHRWKLGLGEWARYGPSFVRRG